MSKKHLVCQGAICECQYGNFPDKLKVLTQSKHYINDKNATSKLVVTHVDIGMTFENNTFGLCKLQPTTFGYKPCIPILQEWTGQYKKITYKINNGNPLLEDSKGICAISGSPSIKINDHGETAELTQQNIDNADNDILVEFLPFVN